MAMLRSKIIACMSELNPRIRLKRDLEITSKHTGMMAVILSSSKEVLRGQVVAVMQTSFMEDLGRIAYMATIERRIMVQI